MLEPIHKYNGGKGATLCHKCSVIINTGFSSHLYCDKCIMEANAIQVTFNNTKDRSFRVFKLDDRTHLKIVSGRLFSLMGDTYHTYHLAMTDGHYIRLVNLETGQGRTFKHIDVVETPDGYEDVWQCITDMNLMMQVIFTY